jgi:hypothetical protein
MGLRAPGQHREIRVRCQEENVFALTIMFFPSFSAFAHNLAKLSLARTICGAAEGLPQFLKF